MLWNDVSNCYSIAVVYAYENKGEIQLWMTLSCCYFSTRSNHLSVVMGNIILNKAMNPGV